MNKRRQFGVDSTVTLSANIATDMVLENIDVMLLVDCFKNFKDLCLKTYGLDPNYYFTAPVMSFDCMLKYTEVNLKLLSDYDQILMFEQGM